MNTWFLLYGSVASYLLGSIPSAVWIGTTFYGIDVREHGSGNAGATNTLRVLGKKAGILVLFVDLLKGLAAGSFALIQNPILPGTSEFRLMQMLFGVFCVAGHIYPVFANFKGGKGIATLLGVVIAISWPLALSAAICFVLIVWLTRYISLGSMVTCLLSPLFVWAYYGGHEKGLMCFCFAAGILVAYTHRSNIKRLLNGNENRFSFQKKLAQS